MSQPHPEVIAKLKQAQELINESVAIMEIASGVTPVVSGQPATEAPPCMSACRQFIDRAIHDRKLNMEDYGVPGIQQGSVPGYGATPPRMTQANQDKLEKDVRDLLASEYGQEYLSDQSNAAAIDRRYCFAFTGYFLTKKSNNPDDGYVINTRSPGPLPV